MVMKNLFLILAVFLFVVKSQQNPVVSMHPSFKQVYSGDSFNLSCDNSTDTVKWFFNSTEDVEQVNQIWSIGAASTKNSGVYQCESNGQKSDPKNISVLECLPPAGLIISSGMPVVTPMGSVVLELEVDDGLEGWWCSVSKGLKETKLRLKKSLATASATSLAFQSLRQRDNVAIYWCSNRTQRSSPISIWRSDKMVVLDIPPGPAVLGEKLSLNCMVRWTSRISQTIFYKNNIEIQNYSSSSYVIHSVTEKDQGKYHCRATYILEDNTSGIPAIVTSDSQELFVTASPPKAFLSGDLSCSCSSCPSSVNYRWYHLESNQLWKLQRKDDWPAGTYKCRAVWNCGRSAMSNFQVKSSSSYNIVIIIIIALILVLLGVITLYFIKRRRTDKAIYQDVPVQYVKDGDGGYQELSKKRSDVGGGDYDTLNTTSAEGKPKHEGQYEALNKGKVEVYHTLGEEGAKTGDKGYEALKVSKDEGAEGIYHALGPDGVKDGAGGDGGYEALKMSKEGGVEDPYHKLGAKGVKDEVGGGDYEFVKIPKEGDAEDRVKE
ncbi:uncharacterized protein LOC105008617 isoform X2 [Esox lucius]|uniref:uncharacterized protein LOC105008617 isoform X2 n=1 Tax=Esox lucius TaxID=8010 RepID=UPI0009732126|nr:uncharacterized protein LOC105008617 isoform X2 [Esox lucius]